MLHNKTVILNNDFYFNIKISIKVSETRGIVINSTFYHFLIVRMGFWGNVLDKNVTIQSKIKMFFIKSIILIANLFLFLSLDFFFS